MDTLIRRWGKRPPLWRVAATIFAVFFVVMGSSKLLALRTGVPGDSGPLAAWVGAAEIVGGLMLLVPGLVSYAACLLIPVVGLITLIGSSTVDRAMVVPTAVILVGLVTLGLARRPRALLQARLDRALERVVRSEGTQTEGVRHEGF